MSDSNIFDPQLFILPKCIIVPDFETGSKRSKNVVTCNLLEPALLNSSFKGNKAKRPLDRENVTYRAKSV